MIEKITIPIFDIEWLFICRYLSVKFCSNNTRGYTCQNPCYSVINGYSFWRKQQIQSFIEASIYRWRNYRYDLKSGGYEYWSCKSIFIPVLLIDLIYFPYHELSDNVHLVRDSITALSKKIGVALQFLLTWCSVLRLHIISTLN